MQFPDLSYNLRVELDTEHCELSANQIEKMERGLGPLREPVRDFPHADLYITITFHPRSHDYRVKTALVLPGRTLATGEVGKNLYGSFESCVRKLVSRVAAYKESLDNVEEVAKHAEGTHHDVEPTRQPDAESLRRAVTERDYAAFRRDSLVYEESVRKRIGRWIERYPKLEAQLGTQLSLDDLVEEVFLNAFEQYERRPQNVRLGDWLEELIDPSVKQLLRHPDEEMENIRMARSASEEQAGGP